MPEARGTVAIVSGGTSDLPVVREAQVRAELLGTEVLVHVDAGVAGLHRLEPALADLQARADCVIVVAGWDAALASVVGGLVAAPVIARADEHGLRRDVRRRVARCWPCSRAAPRAWPW